MKTKRDLKIQELKRKIKSKRESIEQSDKDGNYGTSRSRRQALYKLVTQLNKLVK